MYIIICGGGKVGEYLAQVLLKSGNEVVVIEKNSKTANRLSVMLEGRYMVIQGDGCDSRYQEDAGISHADVFVAATGQDDSNLVSCEIAQRVFNVSRCVARVNSPRNMRVFRAVGIESVSATVLIANLIEEEALMGSMSAVTSLSHGDVLLSEIVVPRMKQHSNEDGVLASSVLLPQGCLMVAISTKEHTKLYTPDAIIYPGDKVIIASNVDALGDARTVFRSL